jgi:lipopolysaccharide transport system ATP-binding protein
MSSNDIAISVKNLSKRYEIYNSPRDRLKQFLFPRIQNLIGYQVKKYFREFWAIKNLSFKIRKGETVGIIGRNGAGKSTLLQILCGTLTPSNGEVEINGRVAALLELGAGFSGEFTGRENIYMNAGVLGLSREEIEARFEKIIDFADIGDFLDQPVKTYSSGMYVRLAFAVVIHVDADILIVDEALAVGDISFQAKCMMALKNLMDAGTTVLFVSHDTSSVRNLCEKVLWLDKGKMKAFGEPELTIGQYVAEAHLSINNNLSKNRSVHSLHQNEPAIAASNGANRIFHIDAYKSFAKGWRRYGDGRANILNVEFLNSSGQLADAITLRENFLIRVHVSCKKAVKNAAFGFSFRDLKGNQVISSLTSNYSNIKPMDLQGDSDYCIEIRGRNYLTQGTYTLTLGVESIVEKNIAHEYIDVVENVVVFQSNFGSDPHDIFPGMVWQDVEIQLLQAHETVSDLKHHSHAYNY